MWQLLTVSPGNIANFAKNSQKHLCSILWQMLTNISVWDNHSLTNINVLHQSIWSDELYQKQCSSQFCTMQIEEVGEVWEGTTSDLPALGNEPVWSSLFLFFGKKSPTRNNAQIFRWKSPFFWKSIRQIVPLFKERVTTTMPTGYICNAPRDGYRQLGEIWLNLCPGGCSPVLGHFKYEKQMTGLESCMKTHMLVSVQGFRVLGQFMFKSVRVHDR